MKGLEPLADPSKIGADRAIQASIAISLKRIADQGDREEVMVAVEPQLVMPPHVWQGEQQPGLKTTQPDVMAWILAANVEELGEVAFAVKDRIETLRRQP